MTPDEAEHILTVGCRHEPYSEDVCGNCAKNILEVLHNVRTGSVGCRTCGDPNHTTSEHTDWTTFDGTE